MNTQFELFPFAWFWSFTNEIEMIMMQAQDF